MVEAYYLTDLPGTELWRRLGRRKSLAIRLLPYVAAVLWLAVAPRERYIWWWLPFLAAGLPALAATVSPLTFILRRRREVLAVWPGAEQRLWAEFIIGLVVLSALVATVGPVLLAAVTQDVRFALACAIAVVFLLRWAWVLLSQRRFPLPATPAT